jgi:hypothetical protein
MARDARRVCAWMRGRNTGLDDARNRWSLLQREVLLTLFRGGTPRRFVVIVGEVEDGGCVPGTRFAALRGGAND